MPTEIIQMLKLSDRDFRAAIIKLFQKIMINSLEINARRKKSRKLQQRSISDIFFFKDQTGFSEAIWWQGQRSGRCSHKLINTKHLRSSEQSLQQILSWAFWREPILLTPWSWTSGPRNQENFVLFIKETMLWHEA